MEQFERVKRYYERFKEIDEGRQHCLPSAYYEDDVYSFFINCHHLKDCIINGNTITKETVEDFIEKNDCLKICADICNGVKHLNRKPALIRSGKERKIEFKAYNVTISEGAGAPPPAIRIKFFIEENLDTFKVATECVQKWEEFINKNIV